MKTLLTRAIVLTRTDFGEADRILTLLTPDQGKLRLIAKGVRRVRSKLAGGIELFSVSDITFVMGRGDIGTLVSTRLDRHYGNIVRDIARTMLGYDLIKLLNKCTEDQPEAEYFELLESAFGALDDPAIHPDLLRVWFQSQLLRQSGHTPNLTHTALGAKLEADKSYEYSFEDSAFMERTGGAYRTDDIKFLRILFSQTPPEVLAKVGGAGQLAERSQKLVQMQLQQYLQR